MSTVTAEKALSVPSSMINELATGLEDCLDIAKRYGFTDEEWKFLEHWEPLEKEVQKRVAEFKANGRTFKNTSKYMAEQLLNNAFAAAMRSDTPVKDKVMALQQFAKMGDLEPKTDGSTHGTGFSITINLPSVVSTSTRVDSVDGEATEKAVPTHLELEFVSDKASEASPSTPSSLEEDEE